MSSKQIHGNVFVGIDVHKRTYSITAVSEGRCVKSASMPAKFEVLLAFLRHNFPFANQIYSAYEAGFSGFGLHRFLVQNGVKNIVVHAASIEVEARSKVKNDKRDSKKIAIQLEAGRLTCIYIPSPQREQWRSVTRLRIQFVKHRSSISNQIKSLLFYYSMLPSSHRSRTSKKWILSLLTLENVDRDIFFCIQKHVESWLFYNGKIKEIDEQLKMQARLDFKVGEVYRKFRGIGFLTARVLANELGDFSQFHSQLAAFSYTGLTPCEYSSGDKRYLGNISHQGNVFVRGILIEVAWIAIEKNPQYKLIFDRIVKSTGSRKKAIVGTARRMIGHLRAEFKNSVSTEEEGKMLKKSKFGASRQIVAAGSVDPCSKGR